MSWGDLTIQRSIPATEERPAASRVKPSWAHRLRSVRNFGLFPTHRHPVDGWHVRCNIA